VALFSSVVSLCAGLTVRTTAVNPSYVMNVIRGADVVPLVRDEFLSGLVNSSGLPPAEQAALRRALEEGVPVGWLEAQFERTVKGLADYLGSDEEELRIELATVELKVYLLMAIREHMGELFYRQAAHALQDLPDYVDIAGSFDQEALRRARPLWRVAMMAPAAAGGASLLASLLLWAAAGLKARGVGVVGGAWLAAGMLVIGSAIALGAVAPMYLPAFLTLEVPELRSLPLREVALAGLAGVRSGLLASGVGATLSGLFLLSYPGVRAEGR